jgi:hypothetical protein
LMRGGKDDFWANMLISVGRATLVLCSFVNKRIDDMERRFELDERKNHNP